MNVRKIITVNIQN